MVRSKLSFLSYKVLGYDKESRFSGKLLSTDRRKNAEDGNIFPSFEAIRKKSYVDVEGCR